MTVIARIIAEKLRAFLFDTASLCTPNSDRHSIDSIKEREFWNLFHDSFHIFFIAGVFIIIYQNLLKIFFLIFSQNLVEICEKLASNSIIQILFRANMERKKWYTQRVRYRHYFEDTRDFEVCARDRHVHLYSFDRHRGGLMTGYGILLTFDSCIRYTNSVPVRTGCHQTARAEVSSHPHSSRSKYACGKSGDIICE